MAGAPKGSPRLQGRIVSADSASVSELITLLRDNRKLTFRQIAGRLMEFDVRITASAVRQRYERSKRHDPARDH